MQQPVLTSTDDPLCSPGTTYRLTCAIVKARIESRSHAVDGCLGVPTCRARNVSVSLARSGPPVDLANAPAMRIRRLPSGHRNVEVADQELASDHFVSVPSSRPFRRWRSFVIALRIARFMSGPVILAKPFGSPWLRSRITVAPSPAGCQV